MKIATCCYCGTRAALKLDKARHELACSACGAPLHEMKSLPVQALDTGAPRKTAAPAQPCARPARPKPRRKARYFDRDRHDDDHSRRPRRRTYRKGLGRRILEEVWDAVEDIFD